MEQSGIDMQRGLPELPEGLLEPVEVTGMAVGLVELALAVVLLAALMVLALRWARARRDRRARGPALPPKREAEEALRSLQRDAGSLSAAGFALRLSAVVRRCVDRTWNTGLTCQTWHEHWAQNGDGIPKLPGEEGDRLAHLLADCNALKFEPLDISLQEKEELMRRAFGLIAALSSPPPAAIPQPEPVASR